MASEAIFQYASVVVDDLARVVEVFARLGTPGIWEGEHPFFRTRAVLCAARKGGVLLLELNRLAHPALQAYRGARERYFHLCLGVRRAEEQRELAERAARVGDVSAPYAGPLGPAWAVRLRLEGGHSFWVEWALRPEGPIECPESTFLRVESTAMVAPTRGELLTPLEGLGLEADRRASDGYFPVLAGINSVVPLAWHYLEINEPTGDGAMKGFLTRIGRPGIFGVNLEPVDMAQFVADVRRHGVETNTPEPIRLRTQVRGAEYDCADIITVSPRAAGGARVFVLVPREYPWRLLETDAV